MGYFRIYPTKNNTLFHYVSKTGNVVSTKYDNINTGADPIMELQDGGGESKLIWGFDIPENIQEKLINFDFTANLQLFDAGTLFQPAINLVNVSLDSFTDDFSEGDGYSYLPPAAKSGFSNWLNRDSVNLWSATTFTNVATYQLNTINEDLNFDISSSIQSFVTAENFSPKYALYLTTHTYDNTAVYTKFIYSKYSKTIFQPYIEFFIQDNLKDCTYNCYAGVDNTIYLKNLSGRPFVGTVSATIQYHGGSAAGASVTTVLSNLKSIVVHPTVPTSMKKEYTTVIWSIDSVPVEKLIIESLNPNQLREPYDPDNLFFYPASPYTHNIVRQGDIMPLTVVSQIRGQGDIIVDSYQFKVTSADGFEVIPYSDVSIYRKKMYFYIDTTFFFPEQQYEVWIRDKRTDSVITSNLTFKFKVAMNDKSHLRQLSTSPYYSRDQFLSK